MTELKSTLLYQGTKAQSILQGQFSAMPKSLANHPIAIPIPEPCEDVSQDPM